MNFDEFTTLFGITVEIDYKNPYNVQLYEDITNKIEDTYNKGYTDGFNKCMELNV